MNQKLLALYGLKWNPFTPGVPAEALHVTARLHSFCSRNFSFVGRSRAGEQKLMEKLHYRFTSVLSASRVRMADIILAT